jgi:hypothetical protein
MLRLVVIALTIGSFSTSTHSSRECERPLLSGAILPMVSAGIPTDWQQPTDGATEQGATKKYQPAGGVSNRSAAHPSDFKAQACNCSNDNAAY